MQDNSDKNIILFDGVCVLCNRFVVFVIKQDKKQYYHFASQQSELGKKIVEQVGINDLSTLFLISKGNVKTQSSAVLSIFSRLPFPYLLLCLGYLVPSFIRDLLYKFIARNRYTIFGKTDTCSLLQNKDWQERVL